MDELKETGTMTWTRHEGDTSTPNNPNLAPPKPHVSRKQRRKLDALKRKQRRGPRT